MNSRIITALLCLALLNACGEREANRNAADFAFTIDAAHHMHMEDEIGSIEVGKKADLVVLDQDIFAVDAYDIHRIEVVLTMMDGNIVYDSPAE